MRHHLILVREADQQMSSSGCCGRLEGDAAFWDAAGPVFPERREGMERMGEIYREIRRTFGEEVHISVVDPRNQVSLVPMVIRDGIRYQVPWRQTVRALAANSLMAGILDGELLFRGRIPGAAEARDLVAERLGVALP